MLPSRSSRPHGPPSARPGPTCQLFPGVLALMRPSDSLVSISRRSSRPLTAAYLVRALFLTGMRMRPRRAAAGDGSPALRLSGCFEEIQGPPGLPGHPLRTRRRQSPRWCDRPCPLLSGNNRFRLPGSVHLGHQYVTISRPPLHGSHVRAPTHRRRHCCHRRKARYRLGGPPLTGRVSHPLDDSSEFHEVIASSLLPDRHCPVAH